MTRGLHNGELCEYRGILESHLKVCSAQVLYGGSSITLQYAAAQLDLDRESQPLQILGSKDTGVCSRIYLHLNTTLVVDLDSSVNLVRVTVHAVKGKNTAIGSGSLPSSSSELLVLDESLVSLSWSCKWISWPWYCGLCTISCTCLRLFFMHTFWKCPVFLQYEHLACVAGMWHHCCVYFRI